MLITYRLITYLFDFLVDYIDCKTGEKAASDREQLDNSTSNSTRPFPPVSRDGSRIIYERQELTAFTSLHNSAKSIAKKSSAEIALKYF